MNTRMPDFVKGIKVRFDTAKGLWRIHCQVRGARWSHASSPDKAKMIAVAKDLDRRVRALEDIRPAKFRDGAPRDLVAGSVRELGARWLVEQAKNSANNTSEFYDWALEHHIYPLLGDVAMTSADLTRKRCIRFAQDLIGRTAQFRTVVVDGKKVPKPLAFGTRKAVLLALGALCGWARDEGHLESNPADDLRKYTVDKHELERPIVVWTHDQVAALLKVTQAWAEEWLMPLKFALLAGVRKGELIELRWDDRKVPPSGTAAGRIAVTRQFLSRPRMAWSLGPDGRRVRVKTTESRVVPLKGRRARTVDAWPATWAELETHRKAEREKFLKLGLPQSEHLELMFTSPIGKRLDVQTFERYVLARLCRKAHIPVTTSLHATRHTFATVLLTAGEPLRYVSAQLGHRDESTTEQTYKHWIPDTRFDQDRGKRVAAAWGVKKGKG